MSDYFDDYFGFDDENKDEKPVIDVEANPFVGTVISAETPNGEIYFDKEYQFKPTM